MTTYYEVLRPVEQADLDTQPAIAEVLRMIPPEGHVTFDHLKHVGTKRAGRGLSYACSVGILKRVTPYELVLKIDSIKFWLTQLNDSGHKNIKAPSSTKKLYLTRITDFNKWLCGKSFPSYKTVFADGQVERQSITKSFGDVDELMKYCNESDHGTKTAQRVVREYLAYVQTDGKSNSISTAARSAIKSYFGAHDVVLNLPRAKKNRAEQIHDEDPMSLEDFYKMLQNGRPSITMRTVMLIKLQSGMDSATLADRFNYEGYAQIVRYFKTDDYTMWNLDKCPVPITVIRVKTDYQYTTFLDHDAIVQLREYLTWKEAKCGRHDTSKPLFLNKQGTPIHSKWVSSGFSDTATRAGIQKKMSRRVFKMRAHDVRDLLKSTLLASGCKQYAAEHIIGHAPHDSYEKQAVLYPEDLRAEYAKASSRINIISKVESNLNSPDDPASQDARIRELEAEVAELKQSKTTNGMAENHYETMIAGMSKEIKQLAKILDSLPDDVKARMADDLERK